MKHELFLSEFVIVSVPNTFFLHVPLIFIIMTTVTHINAALCAYNSLLGWIYGVKLVLF